MNSEDGNCGSTVGSSISGSFWPGGWSGAIRAGKCAVRIRQVEGPGCRAWPDPNQSHRREGCLGGTHRGPAERPGLTSFCCRSSSFILISRASARAARFAANLASACNRPGDCVRRQTVAPFQAMVNHDALVWRLPNT